MNKLSLVALAATLIASIAQAAQFHTQVQDLDGKKFDYLVVGGGLGGLVVSKRLSQDPSKKILVIEAGRDDRKDPRIYDVDKYGEFVDTDMNWDFETVPQAIIGNQTKSLRAGKTLGGSTSINGGAWNRAHKVQYDMLKNITGDPTFDFEHLQEYMNRAESFVPPTKEQRKAGADYVREAHGYDGPLSIGFSPIRNKQKRMFTGEGQNAFLETIQRVLGVAHLKDQNSGNNTGAGWTPTSISQDSKRESACRYLEQTGDNVDVLLGWTAVRLSWKGDKDIEGVVVQKDRHSQPHTLYTQGEVILSAGTINTPGILERSGIGAKDVLDKHGIEKKIILPGVGKNLQEQTMNTMGGKAKHLDTSGGGPSNMIANTGVWQIFNNASLVQNRIHLDMYVEAAKLEDGGYVASSNALQDHYKLVTEAMFKKGVPACEHFFDTGFPPNSYGIDTWCLLPYSRGKVHIKSKDAFEKPLVDPNYFAFHIDMQMQVAAMRANRRILQTSPLLDELETSETQPGFEHIPDTPEHGSYAKWQAWILGTDGKGGFGSVAHQIGTCSMMPKKDGGVVDSHFKVYGTKNLRIVDGSVLPIQLSAHLSSTLYGLAEKASEDIGKTAHRRH